MTPQTRYALEHNIDFENTLLMTVKGLPVDVARNDLLKRVLELPDDDKPEYVAFIDADAYWLAGTLANLISTVERIGKVSFVSAGVCARFPFSPMTHEWWPGHEFAYPTKVFENLIFCLFNQMPYELLYDSGAPYMGGALMPAMALGFHMVMTRYDFLVALTGDYKTAYGDKSNSCSPSYGVSEDWHFFRCMSELGAMLYVNTALTGFHVEGECLYAPFMPPLEKRGSNVFLAPEAPPKFALKRSYGPVMDKFMRDDSAKVGCDFDAMVRFSEKHRDTGHTIEEFATFLDAEGRLR